MDNRNNSYTDANNYNTNSATNNPRNARNDQAYQSSSRYSRTSASANNTNSQYAYADANGYTAVNSAAGANGSTGENYGKHASNQEPQKPKHRRWWIVLVIILAVVVVAAIAIIAWATSYVRGIEENFTENLDPGVEDTLVEVESAEEPYYMLLLGTDTSAEREASGYADETSRSDSIMLLRIDEQNKKVTDISIHRDTVVELGEYGTQKINAAFAFGGVPYAIETISDFAGVPISHYAEIDFDGFREVVDALGGIEVEVPVEINDEEAGGHLDAGWQTLNGEQALILCRSRHTYDDIGDGDQYRAANQRMVIAAIARKILDSDLGDMLNTIEILSRYVTTDMTVEEIYNLAMSMRGMNTETDFYTGINPTSPQYVDGVWYEFSNDEAWQEMMSRVKAGLSPNEETVIDPYTGIVMAYGDGQDDVEVYEDMGTVAIRNGTSTAGLAADVQNILEPMGYVCDIGDANRDNYEQSIVVFNDSGFAVQAQEIADSLGMGEAILNSDNEYAFDTDILVLIGADWP